MGALRAAECGARTASFRSAPIANWYARGTIDGDDEVAVLVDPAAQRAADRCVGQRALRRAPRVTPRDPLA